MELLLVDDPLYLLQSQISCDGDDGKFIFFLTHQYLSLIHIFAKLIKPGVTTKELDKVAEEFIRDNGAVPTFKGFPNQYGDPFPSTLCTSVNDQVVHGIPLSLSLIHI